MLHLYISCTIIGSTFKIEPRIQPLLIIPTAITGNQATTISDQESGSKILTISPASALVPVQWNQKWGRRDHLEM